MQSPCRVVNLPLATIDPSVPSSHTHHLRLPNCPPFSSGTWSLAFLPSPTKPGKYTPSTVKLAWSGCGEVAPWSRGRLCVAEKEREEGRGKVFDLLLQPDEGSFPSRESGEVEIRVGRPTRPFEVYLDVDMQDEETTSVSRCLALIDQRPIFDVCLTFPPSTRTLWASSSMLAEASPWWKTTLSAIGFSEGFSRRATHPLSSQFDDSDDEQDDEDEDEDEEDCMPLSRLATPPPSPPLSPPLDFPAFSASSSLHAGYRTIPITGTSHSTYRAFLCYLLSGQLSFAPLTSTFLSPPTTPHTLSRKEALDLRAASLLPSTRLHPPTSSPLPPSVSPKSLFRLAHFLEIPSLAERALSALREGLSADGVAYELFGSGGDEEGGRGGRPLGEVYDQVWEMELAWARAHWGEVKASRGMREAAERMRRREEGATAYEVETLLRLAGVEEG
ncbi:hypothetical protein JCM6882_007465 [Rhodosporidiobolus microsporus]